MLKRKLVMDFFAELRENIEKTKILKRELKITLIENKATSIVGPRRAGKTYYLKFLAKKFSSFFYVDFENIIFRKIEPLEIFEILALYTEVTGEKPKILFLDEIQNLKEWQSVVRSLIDRGYIPIITGSSSKLLSREIATQLRGRTLSYLLLPFSFREYLFEFKRVRIKRFFSLSEEAKIKKNLRDYLFFTSYPEILITGNKRLLNEYYTTIFYRDFVERFGLKSVELAKFIFNFFLQNFSKEFSINKIANFLKSQGIRFGKNTIYNYVEKLPETLNVFFVERAEKSIYKRLWPRKVYICDLGLADIVSFSKDFGKRMENTVFLELLRKTNENPLLEIYYWKDYQQREVDFLVKEGLRIKKLIQVTYTSGLDEIERRELKSLVKAYDLFKKDKPELLIISWDFEDEIKFEGKKIRLIPLWKWLLSIA